jgi:isoleucyl-tRNA synthetase
MQKVIELGRVSRERRTVGLKTPLKTLIIIHPNSSYLEDVRSLEGYIREELNVRDLVLSTDEAKYNVQYSVTADWPTLGKKLRKDAVKVRKALATLTNDQAKKFVQDKTITLEGIKLEEEDLIVKRELKEDDSSKNMEPNTDNEVLTILDTELYPELAHEGIAREIINRVQRLRKKAGLVPTDDVKMEYTVLSDPDKIGIGNVFTGQSKSIEKSLRRPVDKHVANDLDVVIIEEEQEVQKATFLLRLVKL